jgi:hypothetical protein
MTDDYKKASDKIPYWKNAIKPCRIVGFCPYGGLVEMYPHRGRKNNKMSCSIFGHDCPVFYNAEIFVDYEEGPVTEEERTEWDTELHVGTFGEDDKESDS